MEFKQFNKIETKENNELESKHKSWIKDTVKDIGMVVGGGLISYVVLEKLGVQLPSYLISSMVGGAYFYIGNNKKK